jgi:hypothetical protein
VLFLYGRTDEMPRNEDQPERKKAGNRKILLETAKFCHFGDRKLGLGAGR